MLASQHWSIVLAMGTLPSSRDRGSENRARSKPRANSQPFVPWPRRDWRPQMNVVGSTSGPVDHGGQSSKSRGVTCLICSEYSSSMAGTYPILKWSKYQKKTDACVRVCPTKVKMLIDVKSMIGNHDKLPDFLGTSHLSVKPICIHCNQVGERNLKGGPGAQSRRN